MLAFNAPVRVKLSQYARYAVVPPPPIHGAFAKDIAGRSLYKRRILGASMILVFHVNTVFQSGRERTKSNAAIFLLFIADTSFLIFVGSDVPTSRLCLTTRHVISSGSFLEIGVKKFATAFSTNHVSHDHRTGRAADFLLTRGGGFDFPLYRRRRDRPLPGADTPLEYIFPTHCDVSTIYIMYETPIYACILASVRKDWKAVSLEPFQQSKSQSEVGIVEREQSRVH